MKTDIEIAQEAVKLPIKEVAESYGIVEDDLELYGKYKAKITDELWQQVKDRPDGKLVLVTAINRGQDHDQHRSGRCPYKTWQEDHDRLA